MEGIGRGSIRSLQYYVKKMLYTTGLKIWEENRELEYGEGEENQVVGNYRVTSETLSCFSGIF